MTSDATPLVLHPDRLFPPEGPALTLARDLYQSVRELPIISPHGHIDAQMIASDEKFADPTSLLISPDHYITRLLHASGFSFDQLGIGKPHLSDNEARAVWRLLCENWRVFAGTPVRYWLECQLVELFNIFETPTAQNANSIYDQILSRLKSDTFRPRALFDRFNIEVIATTNDPSDDLSAHAALASDQTFSARLIPTFRPDRLLDPSSPDWLRAIEDLSEAANVYTSTYQGFLEAISYRREYFIRHGATSVDYGLVDTQSIFLSEEDASGIYKAGLLSSASPAQGAAFRRSMLTELARMSCDDGLVLTIHPGALRNYHAPLARQFGADRGHDIPIATEYTRALRELLGTYGTHPNLHIVLFTLDETAWSREIAPLAGFFPSVYIGAPWWFLDAPAAIRRFYDAVIETAGFSRLSGFIDDTRAFCSIPIRHDMSRRLDCRYLAELVVEHRLSESEAAQIALDLVTAAPRRVFRL